MKPKYERPDYVKNFSKPKNTEIKHINGRWYLYERATSYDPVTKKSTKTSGKMIGTITEDGFVPKKIKAGTLHDIEVVELGASHYFYEQGSLIRQRLQEVFPDIWREMFTIAVLRLIQDRALKRCNGHYQTSILSAIWPDLALSPASISRLLKRLGKDRKRIKTYLLSFDREADRFMLVDGHRLLSSSRYLDAAEVGYDSKCRYKPQINLLYMFSLGEGVGYPEYYKQYPGSITDVTAISDLLKESGRTEEHCTLVADKGFGSSDNFDLIVERNMKYLIPLKRGNCEVKGKVPRSQFDYELGFTYHGRSIFAQRIDCGRYTVHLFFDPYLLAKESADLLTRHERKNSALSVKREKELARRKKGNGRLTDGQLDALVPLELTDVLAAKTEMGTISIRTNRNELNSQQVYSIYKQRQAVEQFFKTFDCTLDYNASYMQDDYSLEGWLFLNHLSMSMAIETMDSIAAIGKTQEISLDDLIQGLRKIKATKIDGTWYPAKVTDKVNSLCMQLGLKLHSVDELVNLSRHSAP